MISKNITVGSLDIETETGRIWLNCPNCILRITNLKFVNTEEKFSIINIDANGANATMIPGEQYEDELWNFLESTTSIVIPKILSCKNSEDAKQFLEKLVIKLKDFSNECS